VEFNPNKPAQTKKYIWATYVPDRHPAFKLHAQQNHAKSAFQYRSNAILYAWNSDTSEWEEVFRVENNDYPVCEHGGSPSPYGGHTYHKWVGKGRESKRFAICKYCYFTKR
jgi:hypothetical protein